MDYLKHKFGFFHLLSLPVIYSVFFPFLVLDLFVEFYHRVCFPIYGLPLVKRPDYIRIDRHKLSYLHFWQKLGCVWCGYANGGFHYWSVIAARTEQYFCGIMHERIKGFVPPNHHKNFLKYGDEDSFKRMKR